MTRLSELQDILTSTPASPDSSTQNPVSPLRILSYASYSHPASTSVISVLITDTICAFLPCAETNWQVWKLPQVPVIYLSQTITSSFSRMQKAVPWKQLTQHHNVAVFYCTCRSEAQRVYRSKSNYLLWVGVAGRRRMLNAAQLLPCTRGFFSSVHAQHLLPHFYHHVKK